MSNSRIHISLLTGGNDPPYVLPLASALASQGVRVDFIANDEMQSHHSVERDGIHYLNLRGDQDESAPMISKITRVAKYYLKLIAYAATTETKIFHIIWLNKFIYFDRVILNLYYRLLGKKIVFTAHNVNAKKRDNVDTYLNRLTLKLMYKIVSHIFVHTDRMKRELCDDFNIEERKVTVIPFGINNTVPQSNLSPKQAKNNLGLNENQRVLLFFGQIAPYKGLDQLLLALKYLNKDDQLYKLIIAGKVKKGFEGYWDEIDKMIRDNDLDRHIISAVHFIPDCEVEVYFKAADVSVLPYKNIFQTGVLFLAYSFGVPVIATDAGSLGDDVVDGVTGFVCKYTGPESLSEKITYYFDSRLFSELEANRSNIIEYANGSHSWDIIGKATVEVYRSLVSTS